MENLSDERTGLWTTDWTTRHAKQWLEWLADLVGKPNVAALEIGAWEGRTTQWLCERVLTGPGSRIDVIDPWVGYERAERVFDRVTRGLPVRKYKGGSHEILPMLAVDRRRYQLIYVDGSHHPASVLHDFVLAWSLLCRGGLLIGDDYGRTSRRMPVAARVAIDAWLSCHTHDITGYELSATGQIAVWKREE